MSSNPKLITAQIRKIKAERERESTKKEGIGFWCS